MATQTTAPAPATDDEWWERLYDGTPDTATRPVAAGSTRLPDWRKGETIPLGGADTEPDQPAAEPDQDDGGEQLQDEDEPDTAEQLDDDQDDEADPADDEPRPTIPRPRRPFIDQLRDHRHQPHRRRVLLYNGTAAGAGWALGLAPRCQALITECGQQTHSTSAALTLGVGIILATGLIVDRRTRHWWGPLPWILRIPLASAILALALYTPTV